MSDLAGLINAKLASAGALAPWLQAIKGWRNGIVYGAKIRAPHALVMTLLFASGSPQDKLQRIFKLTLAHAKNLSSYVLIYKSLVLLMRFCSKSKTPIHSLIAGGIGGWIIFGQNTPVNQQIVMYVLARNIIGIGKLIGKRIPALNQSKSVQTYAWPVTASIVWAVVMYLFELDAPVLQSSMRRSMEYLYWQSDSWKSWHDFLL